MNIRMSVFLCGLILILFGFAMFVPFLVGFFADKREIMPFLYSAAITVFIGATFGLAFYSGTRKMKARDMFLFTTMAWFAVSAFAALPFYFSELNISYTDAFFETISGLTTTGSTVLTGLDNMPRSILFWRSLLQWIGGAGIIVLAIAILPILQVGGMQLFSTESSDNSDKALPKAKEIVTVTVIIYVILSVLCAITYFIAGMNAYDAITHAMTTLSSGGYSNYDASLGHFKSPTVQWSTVIFMTVSATPLFFYYHVFKMNLNAIRKDTQTSTFLLTFLIVIAVMSIWLWVQSGMPDNFEPFARKAAVNIISVVSTTGYASEDYTLWGNFAVAAFLFLTLCGGCTGSTAGGVKMFRFGILYLTIKKYVLQMISPHTIYVPKYNDKIVTDDVINGVLVFLSVFIVSIVFFTLAACLTGLDLATSLSGCFTSIANVGPGIGNIIGPSGNFQPLPDTAKWLFAVAMLFGRLEFLTVIALFSSTAWKE